MHHPINRRENRQSLLLAVFRLAKDQIYFTRKAYMEQVSVEEKTAPQSVKSLVIELTQTAIKSVKTAFDALIAQRVDWEHSELTRSNDRLYEILQSCYALYKSMDSTSSSAMGLKSAFKEYYKEQFPSAKADAPLITRIVRAVFGQDRRLVSAYAIALREAADKNVGVLDIPQFFRSAGGVEEVRRTRSPNHKTAKEKAEIGSLALKGKILASVQSDDLAANFKAVDYEGAVILLSTHEANGSFAIRRVVQSGSAITAVLSGLANSMKEETAKKLPEQKASNDDTMREEAISQAVNS